MQSISPLGCGLGISLSREIRHPAAAFFEGSKKATADVSAGAGEQNGRAHG
jgi:hypothetical protein